MTYDFDRVIERRGTNSLKYDFAAERKMPEGLLPLWVADMDFPAPPEVLKDLRCVMDHGVFGYTEPKDDYYNAVTSWFGKRFGLDASPRDIIKSPGVVFALAQAVRAFTRPGETVMIQTPVYYPFFKIVGDNGRELAANPLVYKDGRYTIDFDDFESKIAGRSVKAFLLCNPHNPVGRVWTRAELERMNEICGRYNVIIISDEIHCDFVWRGHTHTNFGLINENAVIATAPSKTFNLAGLQASNIFVKDPAARSKLKEEINRSGYSQLSAPGIVACQSAYSKGGEWLEALKVYLTENIRFVREFLNARLPKIHLAEPEGTYLLWLDFKNYGLSQDELDKRVIYEARLWLDSGTMFGREGEGFQRINAACPRATLEKALNRLERTFGGL
ncbi:MAG: pyridoxal phosphate-dependent aminotransferase [Clostridiales bacterium]|jgi:cystathionine beta-lyase|nr:pyridoxal phosphate-dependent aminotransferase [Clostridiales bacterium]